MNLTSPVWPQGEGAYAYGSLLFQYSRAARAATRRSRSSSSKRAASRSRSFSITQPSTRSASRSSTRGRSFVTPSLARLPRHRQAARACHCALSRTRATRRLFPHLWRDSSTVLYGGDAQKDVPGLYAVNLSGVERRLDRRNDAADNDPVATHTVVYDQSDYTSPYEFPLRSLPERPVVMTTGVTLTHGGSPLVPRMFARPMAPSSRYPAIPAATQLVLGLRRRPSHHAALDAARRTRNGPEPRWSPEWPNTLSPCVGRAEAFRRSSCWIHRARSSASSRAVSPSNLPRRGRRTVVAFLFTSDRTGHDRVYSAESTPASTLTQTRRLRRCRVLSSRVARGPHLGPLGVPGRRLSYRRHAL